MGKRLRSWDLEAPPRPDLPRWAPMRKLPPGLHTARQWQQQGRRVRRDEQARPVGYAWRQPGCFRGCWYGGWYEVFAVEQTEPRGIRSNGLKWRWKHFGSDMVASRICSTLGGETAEVHGRVFAPSGHWDALLTVGGVEVDALSGVSYDAPYESAGRAMARLWRDLAQCERMEVVGG